MDIDFHYFATYAAARFAGLSGARALTIASSAQMIDENSLGAAGGADTDLTRNYFKKIAIKNDKQGPTLLDYQIIQTFQSIGDILSSNDMAYKAFWPVFHFLPGNFQSGFPSRLKSTLWTPREFTGTIDTKYAEHGTSYFPWLTRPYSPMAISLINNCRELIHDSRSDINKHGLADYLIGVTMHVFIDTWAHQDFVGYTSWLMNGTKGNPTYYKGDPINYREDTDNTGEWKNGEWKGTAKTIAKPAGNETIVWLGHGPVGHWPDHSSMIYRYTPNWSSTPILRNNPKEYMAAFVNMIHAIICIEKNIDYMPIKADDALKISNAGPHFNHANLSIIRNMIYMARSPEGRNDRPTGMSLHKKALDRSAIELGGYDAWDKNMWYFNADWINALISIFMEPDNSQEELPLSHWTPGKSTWVKDAAAAGKKGYLTPLEFSTLDYFKFNIAAKFHFRFVQQQLKSFGQQLLGDWPVGFAYGNDLSALESSFTLENKEKTIIMTSLRELQRTAKKSDVQEGLTVLISEVQSTSDGVEARAVLHRALSLVDAREQSWNYGLINKSGGMNEISVVTSLRKIAGPLEADTAVKSNLNQRVQIALQRYKKETSGFFTNPSKESKAAEAALSRLASGNEEDLMNALNYILGREPLRPGILRDDLACKPIKSDGRLYKILFEVV